MRKEWENKVSYNYDPDRAVELYRKIVRVIVKEDETSLNEINGVLLTTLEILKVYQKDHYKMFAVQEKLEQLKKEIEKLLS